MYYEDMKEYMVPLQRIAAEMSALGTILQNREAFLNCKELLRPEHFWLDTHTKIFAAIQDFSSRNEAVDLITITNELRRRNELEEMGNVPL